MMNYNRNSMKNNIDPGLYTKDILENSARKNNIQEPLQQQQFLCL